MNPSGTWDVLGEAALCARVRGKWPESAPEGRDIPAQGEALGPRRAKGLSPERAQHRRSGHAEPPAEAVVPEGATTADVSPLQGSSHPYARIPGLRPGLVYPALSGLAPGTGSLNVYRRGQIAAPINP